MHYAEYKLRDPSLVQAMLETFPFAAIVVNNPDGPMIAQAPLTYREGVHPAGAFEFHLAKANPIAPRMSPGTPITVLVQGPGASISPSWYEVSYPSKDSDRSKTAPTYNYLSLVINGYLQFMDDDALQTQIRDLVRASEPKDGWQTDELSPELWKAWRALIQGYRVEVERFDLTAKFSTGDSDGDKPGVISGLKTRAVLADLSMAQLLESYDGSSTSLHAGLVALRKGSV